MLRRLRGLATHPAAISYAVRTATAGLHLVATVVLARLLGAEGFGVYAYAMAIVTILFVPASLNLPPLIVRSVAAYGAEGKWSFARGLLRRGGSAVLAASLGLAVLAAAVGWLLAGRAPTVQLVAFWAALPILPLRALAFIHSAALRGLNRVVESLVFQQLLAPAAFLGLVAAAWTLQKETFDAVWAAGLHSLAAGLAAAGAAVAWFRRRPVALREAKPAYDGRAWLRSGGVFLSVQILLVLNANLDAVVIGAFLGPADVGVYRAATRVAELVTFSLFAVNMVLQPRVAASYARGERAAIQRLVTRGARAALAAAVPVAVGLAVFAPLVLVIFGDEFADGSTVLVVLALAQLVNVACGSVGLILNMTGHEVDSLKGVGAAAALNVVLNLVLVPWLGILGAAIATAASVLVWNVALAMLVISRTGIVPFAVTRMPAPFS